MSTSLAPDNSFSENEATFDENCSDNKCLLSAYLDKIQPAPQSQHNGSAVEKLNAIYTDIENFDEVYGRLPLNNNILEFYHSIKFRKPHLYKLALTVLATPATQVSVERAFSALNFILTEKRNKLSQENLNSLLVVKLNS